MRNAVAHNTQTQIKEVFQGEVCFGADAGWPQTLNYVAIKDFVKESANGDFVHLS